MSKIDAVAAYLCQKSKKEMSLNRLTYLFYLADWYSALVDRKTITNINYDYKFSLKAEKLENFMRLPLNFKVTQKEANQFGVKIKKIEHLGLLNSNALSEREEEILSVLLEKVDDFYFNDLVSYALSTFPFQEETRYVRLDLLESSEHYHAKNDVT